MSDASAPKPRGSDLFTGKLHHDSLLVQPGGRVLHSPRAVSPITDRTRTEPLRGTTKDTYDWPPIPVWRYAIDLLWRLIWRR